MGVVWPNAEELRMKEEESGRVVHKRIDLKMKNTYFSLLFSILGGPLFMVNSLIWEF